MGDRSAPHAAPFVSWGYSFDVCFSVCCSEYFARSPRAQAEDDRQAVELSTALMLQPIRKSPDDVHAEPADLRVRQDDGPLRFVDLSRVEGNAVVLDLERHAVAIALEPQANLMRSVIGIPMGHDIRDRFRRAQIDTLRGRRGHILGSRPIVHPCANPPELREIVADDEGPRRTLIQSTITPG